jgi:phosphate transport system substrate-binding protein
MRSTSPILVSAALAVVTTACGAPPPPIVIEGSSTLHPITAEAVKQYGERHGGQPFTLRETSTGAGLAKFCAGELDIADASRHITAEELAACRQVNVTFVEVPIAYDAISVVVNRSNTWAASMTVPELRKVWEPGAEGRVMKWSQVRQGWPDREIHLYGPDRQSGTFDYFTEAIVGRPKQSRGDYKADTDDTKLVAAIEADELGLGYFGYTYFNAQKDRLRGVAINDLDDEVGPGAIEPTAMNVRRGVYSPLSRTLFLYVKAAALDRDEVRKFVEFYIRLSPEVAERAGGVRLNAGESDLALARLTKRTLGTMFLPNSDPRWTLQEMLEARK